MRLRAAFARRTADAADGGRHARALPLLESARQRDRDDDQVQFLLAHCLNELGRGAEAVAPLKEALRRLAAPPRVIAEPATPAALQRSLARSAPARADPGAAPTAALP